MLKIVNNYKFPAEKLLKVEVCSVSPPEARSNGNGKLVRSDLVILRVSQNLVQVPHQMEQRFPAGKVYLSTNNKCADTPVMNIHIFQYFVEFCEYHISILCVRFVLLQNFDKFLRDFPWDQRFLQFSDKILGNETFIDLTLPEK